MHSSVGTHFALKIYSDLNMLKFITGNKTKFKEVSAVLAPIKLVMVNISLEEIQELDSAKSSGTNYPRLLNITAALL